MGVYEISRKFRMGANSDFDTDSVSIPDLVLVMILFLNSVYLNFSFRV